MADLFISLRQAVPRMPDSPFTAGIDWTINLGEVWTVVGRNGSGKSLLAQLVAGRYALKEGGVEYPFLERMKERQPHRTFYPHEWIKIVSFDGVHSLSGFRKMYYQQRFNSTESEDVPLVADLFAGEGDRQVVELLDLSRLLSRRLNYLSSGELRKLLIAKALLDRPAMLIFDNPFIGLDEKARRYLDELFGRLVSAGMQLVFLVPSAKDIPACTTHFLQMEACRIVKRGRIDEFPLEQPESRLDEVPVVVWERLQQPVATSDYEEVVRMSGVDIAYGDLVIGRGIDWRIRRGEKWALLGANGSGKSTLLSYIYADNPQAYAKQLWLFGRKRGTGESIWDIKRRIGFTSSEMHLYYRTPLSCREVVAFGLFDTVGMCRKCTPEQLAVADYLFGVFAVQALADKSFLKVSSGEQRLLLFMRALIKNPDLLILDEPFHGLDVEKKRFCSELIEQFCAQPGKSMIYVTHRREEIPACVEAYFELPATTNVAKKR